MPSLIKYFTSAIGAAALMIGAASEGATPAAGESVSAVWKPIEINYAYVGFTTAYGCDALSDRLEAILKTVGAHPETLVRVGGCNIDHPSKNLLVSITTAMPVAASEAKSDAADKDAQKTLKLLKINNPHETFAASWQTVDLARDHKLDLKPGDCELMDGLVRSVFPKLPLKIVENDVSCTPNQLSIKTPPLTVSALIPQKTLASR